MRHFNGHLLIDVYVSLLLTMLAEYDVLQICTDRVNATFIIIFITGSQRNNIKKCLALDENLIDLANNHTAQFLLGYRLFLLYFFLVPNMNQISNHENALCVKGILRYRKILLWEELYFEHHV